jgi:hypothetical protein
LKNVSRQDEASNSTLKMFPANVPVGTYLEVEVEVEATLATWKKNAAGG